MSKCLYAILEIDKSASTDDIKKAYRKMSLKWHPDRNGGSAEATTKFQDITMAYDTLSDEEKKRRYDMGGGLGNMQNMNHNMNHSDILNFFTKSMFGGGMPGMSGMPGMPGIHVNMDGFSAMNMNGLPPGVRMFTMDGIRQGMNKPVPIIKNEEITIGKAYTGCTVPIDITRWVLENGIKREEIETLYFPIPKGIDNNEIIILREKGNIINDTNKGDVKIFIKVLNNTEFIRNGLDLILYKSITLKEALCGFSFDMKYVDDRVFKINNGNGNVITTNYKKIIPDLGMKRDNHIGNLIIEFTVVFPEQLTSEQIAAISAVL